MRCECLGEREGFWTVYGKERECVCEVCRERRESL